MTGACVSPCAFQVVLLGFFLPPLSWFEVLQDERVRLSAPLRQYAQELQDKHEDQRQIFKYARQYSLKSTHAHKDLNVHYYAPWKKCERSRAALWSTQLGDGPQTSSHGRPLQLSAGF